MSAEKPLPSINFFVCSTFEDLKPYRDAVMKNVQSHAGAINAQEFFGARDRKPIATCLEEVDRSHVFVMFLAWRYGSIDPGSSKSFVECEYARAKERRIPKLAYLMDDAFPFPAKYVDTDDRAARLRAFKDQVKADLTIDTFTTPDDLAGKVYKDLLRELPKHGIAVGKETTNADDTSPVVLLKKFEAAPKLFHGQTFAMRGTWADYSRASVEECEAFSYDYGATISRVFAPNDTDIKKALGWSLGHLYAEGEMARMLIDRASGVETEVTVKAVQGWYTEKTPIYKDEPIDPYDPFSISTTVTLSGFGPKTRKVVVGYNSERRLRLGLEVVEMKT